MIGEYLPDSAGAVEEALEAQADAVSTERKRVGELLLDNEAVPLDALLAAVRDQRVDRLRACSLFASLSRQELEELSAVFQEITVPAGHQFITQDDRDPSLYVLASGSCKVFRLDDSTQEVPLARLFPGEPVGEMGYFADGIRSASVRALETSQLLRARYEDLSDCFESAPGVAAAFMEVVTERLRRTNLLYQENQYRASAGEREPNHLEELLQLAQVKDLEQGIDKLLERMVLSASRLTDADRASLFLLDRTSHELWSKVAQGAEVKEIRVPAGAGIVGWVVEHNEMLNVEEAYEDDRFNPDIDRRTGYRTRTILCAPVRGQHGRVLGAVQVINKKIGVFTEDDESLLRAFAAQAAIAIDNINLFREVVHGYRRLAALLEIATLVSQAGELRELSRALGQCIPRLLDCERAAFMIFDAERGELSWIDTDGPLEIERRYPVARLVSGHAVLARETINVDDVYADERFDAEIDRDYDSRTRCLMAAPVIDRTGNVRGVLAAANRLDDVFEDDDVETLELMAAQIGVAALLGG